MFTRYQKTWNIMLGVAQFAKLALHFKKHLIFVLEETTDVEKKKLQLNTNKQSNKLRNTRARTLVYSSVEASKSEIISPSYHLIHYIASVKWKI